MTRDPRGLACLTLAVIVGACAPETSDRPDARAHDAAGTDATHDVSFERDVSADAPTDSTDPPADTAPDARPPGDGGHDAAVDGAGPCPAPRLDCDGTCVDTDTDPRHCGGCDRPCDPGPGEAAACVAGTCERWCAAGFVDRTDAPGCETACAPTVPGVEVCDGLDNDCDGRVDGDDDDFVAALCPLTLGACADVEAPCDAGDTTCPADWYSATHPAATPLGERRCDGVDNDCDGTIDEPCCAGPLVVPAAPTTPADAVIHTARPITVTLRDGTPWLAALAERQLRDGPFTSTVTWAPLEDDGTVRRDSERIGVAARVRDAAATADGTVWALTDDGVRTTTGPGDSAPVADAGPPAAGVDRIRVAAMGDATWLLTGPSAPGRAATPRLHTVRAGGVVDTGDAGPAGTRPVAIAPVGDLVAVVLRAVDDAGVDALVVVWLDADGDEARRTTALTFDSAADVLVSIGDPLIVTVRAPDATRVVTVTDADTGLERLAAADAVVAGHTRDRSAVVVTGAPGDLTVLGPTRDAGDPLGQIYGASIRPVAVHVADDRTWLLATVGDEGLAAWAVALSDEGAPLCDPADPGPLGR